MANLFSVEARLEDLERRVAALEAGEDPPQTCETCGSPDVTTTDEVGGLRVDWCDPCYARLLASRR